MSDWKGFKCEDCGEYYKTHGYKDDLKICWVCCCKMEHCNKCDKSIRKEDMNDLEVEELKDEGSFVCSTCINEEMEDE